MERQVIDVDKSAWAAILRWFLAACLVILAFGALVAVVSIGVMALDNAPQDADVRPAFRHMAEELIKQNLKSPATADFAPHNEWTFVKIDERTWRMTGWVDSQNSFGALLRNDFTAIVRRDGQDLRQLKYLDFDGQEIGDYLLTPDEQQEEDRRRREAEAARQAELRAEAEQAAKERAEADAAERAARQRMLQQAEEIRAEGRKIREQRARRRQER